jgi:histidine triad (HIT) family protein
MTKTIFEKIIAREIPAHIIYEDDLCIAFLDIAPTTYGHTLVVPKHPYINILDVEHSSLLHIITITKELCEHIVKKLGASGVHFVHNAGTSAEQIVPHFHIHIVPRYTDDGIKFWPREKQEHNLATLKKILEKK